MSGLGMFRRHARTALATAHSGDLAQSRITGLVDALAELATSVGKDADTTDDESATCGAYSLADGELVTLEVLAVGRAAGGVYVELLRRSYRRAGAVVTAQESETLVEHRYRAGTLATADADFAVNGTGVDFTVTGVAGAGAIAWHTEIRPVSR